MYLQTVGSIGLSDHHSLKPGQCLTIPRCKIGTGATHREGSECRMMAAASRQPKMMAHTKVGCSSLCQESWSCKAPLKWSKTVKQALYQVNKL